MIPDIDWKNHAQAARVILSREFIRRRNEMEGVNARRKIYHMRPIPPFACKDGFTVSIQAGDMVYCAPRHHTPPAGWSEWELGYPSRPEELLRPWAENGPNDILTDTVYPYVPAHVVMQVLFSHGGWQHSDPLIELREAASPVDWLAVIEEAERMPSPRWL